MADVDGASLYQLYNLMMALHITLVFDIKVHVQLNFPGLFTTLTALLKTTILWWPTYYATLNIIIMHLSM